MNKLVSGAIGVQVNLRTGVTRINLPDVIDLRKKRIKHIDSYIGQTPDDWTTVADQSKLFLTLVEANTQKELIRGLPLPELNYKGNRLFIDKIIDLQRSYIDLSAVTDPATITDKCLYLVFWYDEPAVWGVIDANGRTAIQPLELKLTGLRTNFSENLDLRNRQIQNMLLSFPSITPLGNSGIANANNTFITLSRKGLQFFSRVPLIYFAQQNDYAPLRLQNIVFDLQSSFIETIGVTADDLKTLFFNVLIDDSPKTISRR